MNLAERNETSSSDGESLGRQNQSSGEESSSSDGNEDERGNLQKQIRKLTRIMRKESSVLKSNVFAQREVVRKECEKLLDKEEHRLYALNALWIYYWYGVVKAIIGKPRISNQLCEWLKTFIRCGIKHLEKLSAEYTNSQSLLLIFIGDLNRYAFSHCGRANVDFNKSLTSYREAFCQSSNTPGCADGRPFNQMALLWQEANEPWKSVANFLKALVVDVQFPRAFDNLKQLSESSVVGETHATIVGNGRGVVFNVITSALLKYSRTNMDKWKNKMETVSDALHENRDWENSLENAYHLSLTALFLSKNGGFDDQIRSLGAMLYSNWASFFRHFNGNLTEKSLCTMMAVAGEFFAAVSPAFLARKITVSAKFQYQNLVQIYADFLNAHSEKFIQLYETFDMGKDVGQLKARWILDAPYTDEITIGVMFLKSAIANGTIPMAFDNGKFYVSTSTSVEIVGKVERAADNLNAAISGGIVDTAPPPPEDETDKKRKEELLEKFSKVHLEFVQREEQRKLQASMVPVYLFPDASVFLEKLPVLQNLASLVLKSGHRFIIVTVEVVLRDLDRLKRENQRSREAIRWLQFAMTTAKTRVEMFAVRDGNLFDATLQFMRERNLLERKSLFASILTTQRSVTISESNGSSLSAAISSNHEPDNLFAKYTSISTEDIDAFFIRIVKLEDGEHA